MGQGVLIVYDSSHGTVEQAAAVVASGVRAEGVKAVVEKCTAAEAGDLLGYDALILGSPSYFAAPSASMKKFLDATYPLVGQLEGRVGAAFTASQHIGGGNELTLRALIDFFLIHGMIVQGDPASDPFGAVVVTGEQGEESLTDTSGEFHRLGARAARLVRRLGA